MLKTPTNNSGSHSARSLTRRTLGIAAIVPLAVTGLVACSDDDSAGPDVGVTVEDLQELEGRVGALESDFGVFEQDLASMGEAGVENELGEETLLGQTVTVSGAVTTILDQSSFVMSGDESDPVEFAPLVSTDGVLIVSPDTSALVEGEVVQVVGEVAQFEILTFEEGLGVDLDDELYASWEGQVALIAQSMNSTVPAED